MLRGLAIVAGLATTSILGLATMSVLSVNLATPPMPGAGATLQIATKWRSLCAATRRSSAAVTRAAL